VEEHGCWLVTRVQRLRNDLAVSGHGELWFELCFAVRGGKM